MTSVEGSGRDTDRLQSPGGRSGVTVGLGYDIYGRKANEIVSDLASANIARANAEFLSGANNLRGPDADTFVRKNKNLIFLNSLQKQTLIKKVIEKYEKKLKDNADFPVTQYQFDALVAFTYNSGGDPRVITRSLAAGNLAQAEKDWMSRTHSKDPHHPHSPPLRGLVDRRKREINLYKNGVY